MPNIKSKEEINIINEGGKILSSIIYQTAEFVKVGMNTLEIEEYAAKLISISGAKPSFKGFKGYPSATCISVNDELVHTIPSKSKIIKDGDIVSIDAGLKYKKLFTDMAVTIPIGNVSKKIVKLLDVTKKSLDIAIQQAKAGNTIGDIGYAVQSYIEPFGFSVVRSLVGHGVGYAVHEEPRVPNFGQKGSGDVLVKDMVLALEPMVSIGQPEVTTKEDQWTIVTSDGSFCAHFEHTIVVTDQGGKILTG